MVGREAGDRRGGCSREEAEEAPKAAAKDDVADEAAKDNTADKDEQ